MLAMARLNNNNMILSDGFGVAKVSQVNVFVRSDVIVRSIYQARHGDLSLTCGTILARARINGEDGTKKEWCIWHVHGGNLKNMCVTFGCDARLLRALNAYNSLRFQEFETFVGPNAVHTKFSLSREESVKLHCAHSLRNRSRVIVVSLLTLIYHKYFHYWY